MGDTYNELNIIHPNFIKNTAEQFSKYTRVQFKSKTIQCYINKIENLYGNIQI